VIASLYLISFTSSLDGSIMAIALLGISTNLTLGDKYVGIASHVVLTQTVFQSGFA
ncbi:uncharacterized protein BDR25DRAFT_230255, partial [Lindgomyces ingoldianus]